MGDPRRLRPKVVTPSHPWEKTRIQEELQIVGEYGLRNKWELWKHKTQLRQFRETVRKLRALPVAAQKRQFTQILNKLIRMGLLTPGDHSYDDVLGLSVKDFLDKRLQTQVYKIGLAKSVAQARQFIVHGHVAVNGQIINSPSYLVQAHDEGKIAFALWSPYANKEHAIYQVMVATPVGQKEETMPDDRLTNRPPPRSRKGGRGPMKEEPEGAVENPDAKDQEE